MSDNYLTPVKFTTLKKMVNQLEKKYTPEQLVNGSIDECKEIIKGDPEFKRPEVKTPQPEEEEWAVVTKKGKVKKIKGN